MLNVVVFDLDGTIADCSHRLHYIKGGNRDWDSFYGSVKYDTPILDMKKVYNSLFVLNQIIICTGRSEVCKRDTQDWLTEHGFHYNALYMRKEGDHRPDYKVKYDLLQQMRKDKYNPYLVFEDRTQVVQMWREAGIRCLQVCDGDY